MKKWRIPVSWIDRGTVEVEANTLVEAESILYERYKFTRPETDTIRYEKDSLNIDDTNDYIRSFYNADQPDEEPDTRPAHKPIPPHYRPEVTEPCPHCDSEIGVIWNPEEDGYQIHCPRCGAKMMLCSMCPMHDRCDWKSGFNGEEHCSMMDKYFKVEVVQTSRKTVFIKAADREEAEEKAYELCPGMDFEYVDETIDVIVDSDYTGHPYTGDGVVIIK